MVVKTRTKVIECERRKRQVEVTYAVSGNFLSRYCEIVSCPAMHDENTGCDRSCRRSLMASKGWLG